MEVYAEKRKEHEMMYEPHRLHEPMGPHPIPPHELRGPMGPHPIPPHERGSLLQVEYDEEDWEYLGEVFGDSDSVNAAVKVIAFAPPEMKVLVLQLMGFERDMADTETDLESGSDSTTFGFSAPALDEDAEELYKRLYGEAGEHFLDILNSSPREIAVISRMIAHLKEKHQEEAP